MSTKLAKIVADFRTQLASEIAVGGTSATLQSATDDDGIALPDGIYFFTIDGNNSQKEHIVCTKTGTSLSSIKTVSRQGVQASGVVRKHRIGATVVLTDFAHLRYINDLLDGTTALNGASPLKYDAAPTFTYGQQQLVTWDKAKDYADSLTFAGAPDADEITKGIIELATNAEMGTHTSTGSTGARLVPPNDQLVKTSSGAGDENKIGILDSSGKFAVGFIPTVPVAQGGTGQTTKKEGFDALAPTTTKGDLIVSDGSDNVRLGVGTDNYVLSAASGEASGVKWNPVTSLASFMTLFSASTSAVVAARTTLSEQNLFSIAVPGGTLGSTHGLRGWVWINAVGTALTTDTITLRLKYGSTTMISITTKPNVGSNGLYLLQFVLMANAATNAQKASLMFLDPGAATFAFQVQIGGGTAAEDSTAAKNLILSAQSSANDSQGVTLDHYMIDLF